METLGPLNRGAGVYPPSALVDKVQSGGDKRHLGASYARLESQSETIALSSQGKAQSQLSISADMSRTTATFARVAPANNLSHPPETSANTIVNFIEQKLKQVAENGGDKEALESVLSDGLIGFEKGRDEALDILKGYGFLTDDIKAGIDKTTELVKAGLDELKSQYIEGNPPAAKSDASSAMQKERDAAVDSAGVKSSSINVAPESLRPAASDTVSAFNQQIAQYQQQIASSQSFDFKVQTRDGDVVTLSFSSAAQSSESYAYQSSTDSSGRQVNGYAVNASFSASSNYQLSIKGELDKDELAAIENLLNDIGKLSQDFFSGDMQSAFEKAIDIGFDTSELAAFTLNLSQSESVKVATYQEQSGGNQANNRYVANLAPIGERMNELAQNAIESNKGLDHLALLEPILAITLAFKAEEKKGEESGLKPQEPLLATEKEQSLSDQPKEAPKFGISPQSDYLFELLSMATLRQQMVFNAAAE